MTTSSPITLSDDNSSLLHEMPPTPPHQISSGLTTPVKLLYPFPPEDSLFSVQTPTKAICESDQASFHLVSPPTIFGSANSVSGVATTTRSTTTTNVASLEPRVLFSKPVDCLSLSAFSLPHQQVCFFMQMSFMLHINSVILGKSTPINQKLTVCQDSIPPPHSRWPTSLICRVVRMWGYEAAGLSPGREQIADDKNDSVLQFRPSHLFALFHWKCYIPFAYRFRNHSKVHIILLSSN